MHVLTPFLWSCSISSKEKEAVRDVEKEIADRIKNPLEEGTPLFPRVFEECLSS